MYELPWDRAGLTAGQYQNIQISWKQKQNIAFGPTQNTHAKIYVFGHTLF